MSWHSWMPPNTMALSSLRGISTTSWLLRTIIINSLNSTSLSFLTSLNTTLIEKEWPLLSKPLMAKSKFFAKARTQFWCLSFLTRGRIKRSKTRLWKIFVITQKMDTELSCSAKGLSHRASTLAGSTSTNKLGPLSTIKHWRSQMSYQRSKETLAFLEPLLSKTRFRTRQETRFTQSNKLASSSGCLLVIKLRLLLILASLATSSIKELRFSGLNSRASKTSWTIWRWFWRTSRDRKRRGSKLSKRTCLTPSTPLFSQETLSSRSLRAQGWLTASWSWLWHLKYLLAAGCPHLRRLTSLNWSKSISLRRSPWQSGTALMMWLWWTKLTFLFALKTIFSQRVSTGEITCLAAVTMELGSLSTWRIFYYSMEESPIGKTLMSHISLSIRISCSWFQQLSTPYTQGSKVSISMETGQCNCSTFCSLLCQFCSSESLTSSMTKRFFYIILRFTKKELPMSYSPRRYSGNGLCTLLFKAQLFSLVASPLWRTQQRFTDSKQIWVREKLTRSIAEKQPTFGWSEVLSTSRLSCSLTWRYCKTPTTWHPSRSFWTSFQPCHSWVFSTK